MNLLTGYMAIAALAIGSFAGGAIGYLWKGTPHRQEIMHVAKDSNANSMNNLENYFHVQKTVSSLSQALEDQTLTKQEVETHLNAFNINSAYGPRQISPEDEHFGNLKQALTSLNHNITQNNQQLQAAKDSLEILLENQLTTQDDKVAAQNALVSLETIQPTYGVDTSSDEWQFIPKNVNEYSEFITATQDKAYFEQMIDERETKYIAANFIKGTVGFVFGFLGTGMLLVGCGKLADKKDQQENMQGSCPA